MFTACVCIGDCLIFKHIMKRKLLCMDFYCFWNLYHFLKHVQVILRKFWVKAQKHDKMDGTEKLLSISQCQTTVVYSVTVHVLSALRGSTPAFEEYCNIWKLTVNTNKTKIVVFSQRKYKTNVVFKIYGQAIQVSY